MNKIMRMIIGHSTTLCEFAHLLIRVGIGLIFVIFGFEKLCSGSENIIQIGSAIATFGITKGYILWGYIAAITEFFGGLAYILGFGTRFVSVSLIWLLFVAIRYHINKGDTFTTWGFACTLLIITSALLISGSGIYSMDYCIIAKESKNRYDI